VTVQIKFGTDGWRGAIAEDYTFDNVRRVTQGFADYLKATYAAAELKRGVVVGGDRRFNSEHFAATVAEVLAGNDIPAHFCGGGIPTPTIAYAVKVRHTLGAINITASHNPPTDNGYKVRDPNGGAIDPAGLKQIEDRIPATVASCQQLAFKAGVSAGLIMEFDPTPAYVEQLQRLVNLEPIRQAGFKIMVDPMWGNGAGWLTRLLSGASTEVFEVHSERNPIFPGGQVDLVPEYVGSGLGYYTLAADASDELKAITVTGDGATNAANLQQALTLAGVDATVLGISAGEDTNAADGAKGTSAGADGTAASPGLPVDCRQFEQAWPGLKFGLAFASTLAAS